MDDGWQIAVLPWVVGVHGLVNLLAGSGRLPKPKAPARAAKLRRRRAIALDFNNIFKIAPASELHLGFYFKSQQLESFV